MKQFLILSFTLLLAACGEKSKTTENASTTTTNETALANGHYEYLSVTDKDSSFLSLDNKDGEITGKYVFRPEVSDGAVGDLKAQIKGKQIVGVFTFDVEGSTVSEQVYLEVNGKELSWKKYELSENPQTKVMTPDTTKLVNTQKYVLR